MRSVLQNLNRSAVAVLAVLFCSPAVAGGQTFQWVDQSGNVVYGDSPPRADTRQMQAPDSDAVVRAIASESAVPAQGMSATENAAEKAALNAALAKLNSVMDEVQALNQQVTDLEKERAAILAESRAAASNRQTAAPTQPQMVIDGPTIMEVAVVDPQPIESRMSDKDRARSRWEHENAGQKRFLERLSKMADTKSR